MDALLFCQNTEESAVLTLVLQQAGFVVKATRDITKAIEVWPENPVDMICATLSVKTPEDMVLVRQMRAQTAIPIIAIVDPLPEEDEVSLLVDGIDLVVTRPYSARLLLARIRALLRRTAGMPFFSLPTLTQGSLTLNPASHTVTVGENPPSRLTQLEFRLLYSLMVHAGQIIPTENIIEQVWGYTGEGNQELVRGLVQRLRSKVEPDRQNPQYILTEKGVGYYFSRTDE
jgi:DNA-binding response OmpR family regulator